MERDWSNCTDITERPCIAGKYVLEGVCEGVGVPDCDGEGVGDKEGEQVNEGSRLDVGVRVVLDVVVLE
eukprot:CAMPEP_0184343260 /NCGR_PEP_ID=MMETSP1089-20130417/11801_1 /TAXON_ID=38269 ORGANISM="Gloeochaete wittrockiana, Strain SAG46.84" /NCGR_SAMPLE_ID=MMETSP1089 /ASSEMBLY_ACC=CAM_ASM_000445 /LENGTH=68 /DNA_ID=CAMNT_0026672481 /DNA_START=145 /DNA_END=351 /DNA_ORIENTATION=+